MSQETLSNIMRVTFVTDDQYNERGFVMRYVFKGMNIFCMRGYVWVPWLYVP